MVRLKLPNFAVLRPVVQFFQATSFYQAVQFKAHLTLMKNFKTDDNRNKEKADTEAAKKGGNEEF